jgi:hypothetical protein
MDELFISSKNPMTRCRIQKLQTLERAVKSTALSRPWVRIALLLEFALSPIERNVRADTLSGLWSIDPSETKPYRPLISLVED